MFSRLKKLLAQCHIQSGDPAFKAALAAKRDYFISRLEEITSELKRHPETTEKNCVLMIRLANILRLKHEDSNGSTDDKK